MLTEAARQMRKQEEYVENRLEKIPALSEVTAGTDTAPALTARLRINGRELEVYKGLEEKVLDALLGVLLHAE